MRKMNLLVHHQLVAFADRRRRSCPLSNSVHCQHSGFIKRRWEEGTGRMTQVVLTEEQPLVPALVELAQFLLQHVLEKQLLPQPQRNCHPERLETTRRESQIGLDQPLELEKRLVVKHDMVDSA